jgi:hypothetical protein
MQATAVMTVGMVAARYSRPERPVRPWMVRRLFERKLLPEPTRLGPVRIFDESDLPVIEAALRAAGYLAGCDCPAV